MGVRRAGTNIERRGNIYYWRPRLPTRLKAAFGRARLSISLGQYDYRRACYIARRMSLLLDELEMTSVSTGTTADQLDRLFEGELARWRTHLEDVSLLARRHGRTDDPLEVEADIEMGWAYRILQYWGPMRPLDFDETCPARALLARQGLGEAAISRIAESVVSEAKVCRSQYFESQIIALVDQAGMPDTIPNRERAKIEWFRARADALLDVGSRWQMVTLSVQASVLQQKFAEAELGTVRDGADERNIAAPSLNAAVPENTASNGVAGLAAIDLPIEKFADEGAQVIDNHKDSWSDATNRDFEAFLKLFVDILRENGVLSWILAKVNVLVL